MSRYTSHADLGGLPGFGFVASEPEGDPFHAEWERKALALALAMGATGSWNIDQSRQFLFAQIPGALRTLRNHQVAYFGG